MTTALAVAVIVALVALLGMFLAFLYLIFKLALKDRP